IVREFLTMPLLAAVGVMGGLLRDCASDTEDIWTFSPFINFKQNRRRSVFHAFFLAAIVLAESLRQGLGTQWPSQIFFLKPASLLAVVEVYITTFFSVFLPLKIWNNT